MGLTLQHAQRLATLISGAMKGLHFYPPGHPSISQPLKEVETICQGVLVAEPELRLGVVDGLLFIDEQLFVTATPAVGELTERLSEKGVEGVTIHRGVTGENLSTFIRLLARKDLSAADLQAALTEERVTTIDIKGVAPATEEEEPAEGETEFETLETYGRALEAIRSVIVDIEKGRIPNSSRVISVVKHLATFAIQDPSTLLGLAMIKDYDNYTFNHSVNVGVLSMALAASVGLDRNGIEDVGIAGFLHDVGKTTIDKNILNKPGKLSMAEFEVMKQHPENGAKIVKEMEGINERVAQAILCHHVRHNRRGYPEWACALSIDLFSEIIAVADCYDAITTLRVYQYPLNPKAALDELHRLSGNSLEPGLVLRFMEMMGKYPVGTLVRLDNNEIAVVSRPNPADSEAPIVKVVIDAHGLKLEVPKVKRLSDETGQRYASIVAIVDPIVKNIDVARYLT